MLGPWGLHNPPSHLAAAAAFMAHDGVHGVTALLNVHEGNKAAHTVTTLLRNLIHWKTTVGVPGTSL